MVKNKTTHLSIKKKKKKKRKKKITCVNGRYVRSKKIWILQSIWTGEDPDPSQRVLRSHAMWKVQNLITCQTLLKLEKK
jgi:hypothetical protein